MTNEQKMEYWSARELSKIFEQIVSGTASDLEGYFLKNKDKVRGEFVVLISGK